MLNSKNSSSPYIFRLCHKFMHDSIINEKNIVNLSDWLTISHHLKCVPRQQELYTCNHYSWSCKPTTRRHIYLQPNVLEFILKSLFVCFFLAFQVFWENNFQLDYQSLHFLGAVVNAIVRFFQVSRDSMSHRTKTNETHLSQIFWFFLTSRYCVL